MFEYRPNPYLRDDFNDNKNKTMTTPFPYDVIGHWMSTHKVELSQEAYLELAELFTEYSTKKDTDAV